MRPWIWTSALVSVAAGAVWALPCRGATAVPDDPLPQGRMEAETRVELCTLGMLRALRSMTNPL